MLRGIFLGGVSGLAITVVVGAVLSLSTPIFGPGPEAGSTAEAPGQTPGQTPESEREEATATDMPRLPAPSDTPDRPDVTRPERPQSDTLELASEALQSVDTPELSAPVGELQGAEAAKASPTEELAGSAPITPVYPSPQAVTPDAPDTDALASADRATPVPPRAEEDAEVTGFPASDLEDMAIVSPSVVGVSEEVRNPEADETPVDETPVVVAEAVAEAESNSEADSAVPEAETETASEADAERPTPPAGFVGVLPPDAPADAPATPETAGPDATAEATPDEATGEDTSEEATAEAGSSMPGTPGTRLIAPRAEPAETVESTAEAAQDAPAAPENQPPIDAYAVDFDNPEGKPILSIVMIDDGTAATPLPANFPYPLTLAVPVTRDDAAQAMRQYRADGYEVLALASVPQGATPSDLENAAQAWLSNMDEVVGVMETPDLGLQSNRAMGERLAAILSETGHGLLLYPDGLDTTRKLASRRDVPAATVFRDLDAEGQDAAVIRRFLDNSAFKASVEGTVILVTRLRPETIEALLVWGLADRASRVALAPVSAALKAAAP